MAAYKPKARATLLSCLLPNNMIVINIVLRKSKISSGAHTSSIIRMHVNVFNVYFKTLKTTRMDFKIDSLQIIIG